MTGAATGFADHFSRDAGSYAAFRPRYPAALFDWLATLPARRSQVWDAATGSGQAAAELARHFERVFASDGSKAQLTARTVAPRVHYFAGVAETSALRGNRFDMVTVAQSYHWFDHARFHAEVGRVLVPGGTLAIWSYGLLRAPSDLQPVLDRFYHETVGPYWPAERAHVEKGYRHFTMPIDEVAPPPLAIEGDFSLARLIGYVRTWSAVGRFIHAKGHDPTEELARELAGLWGSAESTRRISWPITMRAGRFTA